MSEDDEEDEEESEDESKSRRKGVMLKRLRAAGEKLELSDFSIAPEHLKPEDVDSLTDLNSLKNM